MIFDYAIALTIRRHGPEGYSSYESFRPWLRDEFSFRCVYCLKRETWGQVTGEFDIDHFEPQALAPHRELDYINLVYSCRRCNLVKHDQTVADPSLLLTSRNVRVMPDGEIRASNKATRRLIAQLDLNSPKMMSWRMMWIQIVELAEEHDPELYRRLVGFPSHLPNLKLLRPLANHKLKGLDESWHAKRVRGELPEVY